MTLGKIKFSELDYLPEGEREVLLRSALESHEMQVYRSRSKKIMGIVFYSTAAIFVGISIFSEIRALLLGLLFAIGTILTFVATVFIKLQLEVKLVRRLIAKSLNSPQNGNV
jgi:hypothetical protein